MSCLQCRTFQSAVYEKNAIFSTWLMRRIGAKGSLAGLAGLLSMPLARMLEPSDISTAGGATAAGCGGISTGGATMVATGSGTSSATIACSIGAGSATWAGSAIAAAISSSSIGSGAPISIAIM